MKLGATLSQLSKKKGFSLAELSRRSGVAKQTIHGWIIGRKSVNLSQLRKVAEILEVSVHELAFGMPDPHHSESQEILRELFSGDVRVSIQRIERK